MAPRCANNGSAGDNCDNTTAIDYKLSDFVHQFDTRSRTTACSLCGTIHPGHIHGYVERKYRDGDQHENVSIPIPVIICLVALARGTQYTKRLLPEFLTPHSVIRLDYLLEAADLPESKRREDAVCNLLGCIDPRTARHQMRRLTIAINAVSLDLAGRRAAMPELGNLPESKQAERVIQKQLTEKEGLLRELHHRVKNNIVTIESLLSLQAGSTAHAVVNELLTDVFKYAFGDREDGLVSVSIEKDENEVTLVIKDDGIGFGERALENKSPGFGLLIVKMLVGQLDGTYSLSNDDGARSVVRFEL